jgi:hypothetical protein
MSSSMRAGSVFEDVVEGGLDGLDGDRLEKES